MNKQKFHIPVPDEKTIHTQIQRILDKGLQPKFSFFTYLKQMYRQIGFKHLFSDRSEFIFAMLTAIAFFSVYLLIPQSSQAQTQSLYGFIFMSSPVLFLILSIYTYANKMLNNTIEVEMTCKFNVYQIIGFRMLVYSIIAILFNSLLILSLSFVHEEIQFFRAFMLSNTGLFTFSILILFAMMKQRSAMIASFVTVGWTLGNLVFMMTNHPLYRDFLVNMPLFVYVIVLVAVFYFNFKSLKKLFISRHAEGVY